MKMVVLLLDYINENKMNDPLTQAMLKRYRHKNLSIFIISQDCAE